MSDGRAAARHRPGSGGSLPARILVHPGFRKAGSSSIQQLLRKNQELLAPFVRVYARDGLTEIWRRVAMRYSRGLGDDASHGLESIRACCRELRAGLQTAGVPVIISDENLIGNRVFNRKRETIIDWAVRILPILEEGFPEVPVEFFFYTRNEPDWLRSAYNQEVRQQFQTRTFRQWRARVPKDFGWARAQERITAALKSRVTFVRLEDETRNDLPGAAILRAAGVPEDVIRRLENPGAQNVSLSPDLLRFLRLVNRMDLDLEARRKVRDLAIRQRRRFRGQTDGPRPDKG
jgi:hypothetical protein